MAKGKNFCATHHFKRRAEGDAKLYAGIGRLLPQCVYGLGCAWLALPPVQQSHFNTVNLDGAVPDEEIYKMIDHTYSTTTAKLPKYAQKELLEMI